jgi:hypothetical protein
MRLPSYLQQNQYGVFYFRIVFPKEILFYIQKHEFKRSLHTTNKSHAIPLSRLFKIKIDRICRIIRHHKMDWLSTKKLLDKVASDILATYKEYLFVQGLYMGCNFFTDLKIKVRDAVEREPFTNHELQLFFGADLFVAKKVELQYAWRYWIPVFMLYHGVRLEEVAQPFLNDIQEVEGIWCLSSMDLWNTVYENSENGYFRQGKMWSTKCNKKYTLTDRGRE